MTIQVLDPIVAERIAAGEVVERPASVVKELVENSLDAGATEIAVILEDGGKSLIEVIDNGHGMSAEDLVLCAKRHATSKLRSLEDLERIRTLGFRGEALPSIAAVSDLAIVTRDPGSETAFEWTAAAGVRAATFGHFLNSPHGTRIRAAGLFSQIPARLKFLKSQASEVSQVREWLERLALAHPATGFRLVSDDRTVLSLRSGDESARVRAILSDGEDYPLLTASSEASAEFLGLGVRVHWLQGFSQPQARRLLQVVNGRAIRDRLVQQALLVPFRQALLPGQFPAVAVFIEIDPSQIDVNVHPAKTEVRFLDNRKVFHAIESLARSMISESGAPAFAPGPQLGAGFGGSGFARPAPEPFSGWSAPSWSPPAPTGNLWSAAESAAPEPREESSGAPAFSSHPLAAARFAGTVFRTYLLYDHGNELSLLDQHAAHERIRYEQLRARALSASGGGGSQPLLIPEAVRFDRESAPLLGGRLPLLARLGFEAEIFGEDTALFRAVPSEWGTDDLRVRLKNLLERLLEADNPGGDSPLLMDEQLFERLASEACHSAVRAGDPLEPAEVESLVRQLFECEHPWNCPHGRPTVVRVPRARLEEWFQRRV